MTIIKDKIYIIILILMFSGCMEPNDEDLWSYDIISTLETNGFARDVSIKNDTAFVAAGQSGVQIWNLTSKALIKSFYGYYEGGAFLEFEDISLIEHNSKNNLVFVSESNKDVMIYNLDEADSLRYRNTIMSARTKDYVVFSNKLDEFIMYTADNDDGLKWGKYSLDTTNLFGIEFIEWTPIDGSEIYTPGKSMGIDSDGFSKITMAVDQMGVELFSIDSLGSEINFIGRVNTQGNALSTAISGEGVFVACDNAGAVYIPYPNFPTGEMGYRFAEDLTVNHISIKDNIAVLSIGSRGTAIYDITDPTNPIEKGIFSVGYTYKTKFWNQQLLTCTREGIKILKLNL